MSEKPIGKVTHYYDKIGVAIVKFNQVFKTGGKIRFGSEDENGQVVDSMQFDHKPINQAEKDQEVGIKTEIVVKEGTLVYLA